MYSLSASERASCVCIGMNAVRGSLIRQKEQSGVEGVPEVVRPVDEVIATTQQPRPLLVLWCAKADVGVHRDQRFALAASRAKSGSVNSPPPDSGAPAPLVSTDDLLLFA